MRSSTGSLLLVLFPQLLLETSCLPRGGGGVAGRGEKGCLRSYFFHHLLLSSSSSLSGANLFAMIRFRFSSLSGVVRFPLLTGLLHFVCLLVFNQLLIVEEFGIRQKSGYLFTVSSSRGLLVRFAVDARSCSSSRRCATSCSFLRKRSRLIVHADIRTFS